VVGPTAAAATAAAAAPFPATPLQQLPKRRAQKEGHIGSRGASVKRVSVFPGQP